MSRDSCLKASDKVTWVKGRKSFGFVYLHRFDLLENGPEQSSFRGFSHGAAMALSGIIQALEREARGFMPSNTPPQFSTVSPLI